MKYGLKIQTVDKIRSVFSGFSQIDKVIIYRSRAKGNYKTGSDIDLTISGKDLNLRLLHRIDDELDNLDLPYTTDLSIYSHIKNENLLDHIARVGIIFYQRNETNP